MSSNPKRAKVEISQLDISPYIGPKLTCYNNKQDENNSAIHSPSHIHEKFITIQETLCQKLLQLQDDLGKEVVYVYNPIDYAEALHKSYVRRFCKDVKDILILGMNPGPWGMCQTGVPFGDVNHVKNWLKLTGEVKRPIKEHRLRRVEGLNCKRVEVSGDRFWSFLENLSGTPEVLFQHIFIHNYCPLAFLGSTGKNITPINLKAKQRKLLQNACDESLTETLKLLRVKWLVCVGNYVTERAKDVVLKSGLTDVKVITLMHPSPANPTANLKWKEIAFTQLKEADLIRYFTCEEK